MPRAFAARPPVINPGVADLTSSADRMVSYRHQEHFWQTADGAFHLLVNRGTYTPGPGLALFSSFNGALNWTFQFAFDGTNDQCTGDGQLQGNVLSVVYPTAAGEVKYAELQYEPSSRTWAPLGQTSTAFSANQISAINPACGVDSLGTVWCAFVAQDYTNAGRRGKNPNNSIRMVYRPAGTSVWTDTGLVFGPIDNLSIERSARPVKTADGMALVYTVREAVYCAVRSDALPPNSAWATSTIYTSPSPQKKVTDPYASHFSVVGEISGIVHMLFSDDFQALYFRRDTTGVWTAPIVLNASGKSSYCQIALVNGGIAAAYSMHSGNGQYLVSTDGGNSFTQTVALFQPQNSGTVEYGTPRVEMPTRASGVVPVLQQFSDGPVEQLLVYSVPAS